MNVENKKVIGICGFSRAGKDSCSQAIELIDARYKRFALADPLKRGAAVLTNLDTLYFHDSDTKNTPLKQLGGKTPTEFVQLLGTEFVREVCGEGHWCRVLDSLALLEPCIVIPDIRFPNEDEYFRSRYDYMLIRVTRPSVTGEQGIIGHSSGSHVMDLPAEVDIINDGTITQLSRQVESATRKFMERT